MSKILGKIFHLFKIPGEIFHLLRISGEIFHPFGWKKNTDDDYNSIALQAVDIDDIEDWEFSKKFRAKSSGDMKKLMGWSDTKIIQTTWKSSYFAFITAYKGKVTEFSVSLMILVSDTTH